jgi:hypothetical protein
MKYPKYLTFTFFISLGIVNATWEKNCEEFCSLGSKSCKFDYVIDCRENNDKARNIECYDAIVGDIYLNASRKCRSETYNKCLEISKVAKIDAHNKMWLGDTRYYCNCVDALKGNKVEKIDITSLNNIGKSNLEVCDEKGSKIPIRQGECKYIDGYGWNCPKSSGLEYCVGSQKTVECFRTHDEIDSDCFNKEGLPFCRNIKNGLVYH